jgi:ATP-binding cassette subfamily C protein CydD
VPAVIVLAVGYVSWAAALALLLAGPVIPVFMALIGMAAKSAAADQATEQGTLSALLLDRLRAASEIRLLDATERVAADFEAAAARLRGQTMAVLRIAFLSSTVLELFAAIGVALVAVYVGFSLLGMLDFGTWRGALSLGEGLFILMLAPAFFEPLRDLAAAWHDRAAFEAVADRFAAAVATGPRLLGTGHAAAPLPGAPDIAFEAVTAPQAGLEAAALTFPAGARIAVTGPSGAGKSTLLALIAGLAEPDDGTIRVAGEPLDATTADAWRARLAWIGQRPHFIAGSLRANVALAGDAADREGVRDALSIAAAADVAARIPRGLDARIGETGHGVSGGEARRLAVARAAYAGRDVILADEPTADLDSETATAVTDGLLRLADGGATLIVATHDAALAARMDREIRLGGTP